MKTWNQTITFLMVLACIFGLAFTASAASPIHLVGSLQHDGALLSAGSSISLHAGEGVLHITTGSARMATRRDTGAFLELEGAHFQPGGHYLLLANGRPLLPLQATDAGRIEGQYSAGLRLEGFRVTNPEVVRVLSRGLGNLSLIELGRNGISSRDLDSYAKRDGDGKTTALCGEDPMVSGEVDVHSGGGGENMLVFAMGLDPSGAYTVIADGITIGEMNLDYFGGFTLFAGEGGDMDIPLPEELGSVMEISIVQVLTADGVVVLEGNFDEPCDDDPGGGGDEIVDSGYIEICPGEAGNFMRGGEMDWMLFADGTEIASVFFDGASSSAAIEILFDGASLGAVNTDDWGSIYAEFSSAPEYGELPLPDEVLPLSSVSQVDLSNNGVVFASGIAGEECAWTDPPGLIDEDMTDLCPVDADSYAGGMSGWAVWDDGVEEFWVYAGGLAPGSNYELQVDGLDVGAYTAGDFGEINLYFSSDPAGGPRGGQPGWDGPGGMDGEILPLPEGLSPVSAIDAVSFSAGDAGVVAGSFVNGCDIPEPPGLIDEDMTDLCPVDADFFGGGMAGWAVWDDGVEEFWVYAGGLAPGSNYELQVDGLDVGAYTAGDFGEINLYFSSDPAGGPRGGQPGWDGPGGMDGEILPLPEGLSPVSAIDAVSFSAGDAGVLAGSFVNGCDLPDPVDLVDENFTQLCSADGTGRGGEMSWQVWDDGMETLQLAIYQADPNSAYEVVIDGQSLGAFSSDDEGMFWLAFSTSPHFEDELPMPEEIQPISGIDVVEIFDASDDLFVSGSFSDPCQVDFDYDSEMTGLCDTSEGYVSGGVVWMTLIADGALVSQTIFVDLWDYEPGTSYTVEIDGIDVGRLEQMDWWGDALGLVLGDGGIGLPAGLDPVSEIDVIRILDGTGAEAASGSFSNPCSDDDPGVGGDGGNGENSMNHNGREADF